VGKHLHVARMMANLNICLHGWFERRSRRAIHGGGRPAAGERRRCVRLGGNEEGIGICLLTTRRSFGRRESSGEVTAAEIDAGGRTSRAAAASSVGYKKPTRRGWELGCVRRGCGGALGVLI
jgi:hypothetical protein